MVSGMSDHMLPTTDETAADILRESGHAPGETPDPERIAAVLRLRDRGGRTVEADDPEPCTHGGRSSSNECVCGLTCCHHTRFADDGEPRWAPLTGCHQFRAKVTT